MKWIKEKLNISNAAFSALILFLILGVVPFFVIFGVSFNSVLVFLLGLTFGGNIILALGKRNSEIKALFWFILFALFLSFIQINNLL